MFVKWKGNILYEFMSILEKIKEILTKKRRLNKWLAFSMLVIGLIMLGFLSIGAMEQMSERRSERESSIYFMFSKGCGHYYDFNTNSLTENIRLELKSVSKKRFREIIKEVRKYDLKDLDKYNSETSLAEEEVKDREYIKKCLILEERSLEIINDLK